MMPERPFFKLNPRALLLSMVLLGALVAIALWVRDGFVRPFLGDLLVVVWLHALARSVLGLSPTLTALGALLLAYAVEFAQYFGLIHILGLEHHRAARVILGATFDPLDLVAYTLGWGVVMAAEWWLARRPGTRP